MELLAHLQDKEGATEEVMVVDLDNLTCVSAVVSNVSQWGCQLRSDKISELRKNIAIRVGNNTRMTKAQILAVKGETGAVVFPKNEQSVIDKRRERRNNVSIPVKITDKEGITEVSGTIVDAGQNGCRIAAKGLSEFPDQVILHVPRFDRPVIGEFAWRNATSGGLRLNWTADSNDDQNEDEDDGAEIRANV
ncbi:PilZ domain-containing protein [Roseibium hamelinense]|uniref:PilZ domain-containing protein n=1 Tax=Roseibium hamelinense TaxID=150831 RepID=A0A562T9H6_9HYPH|nr:PilZ domain-containing protein [Roseibium hamelinense]MTI45332.1 PilZ domain-containing protein [Roseibium hamelinense]TWI90301.1 PilZ domain-containing protein [Roseibium hamelinense]